MNGDGYSVDWTVASSADNRPSRLSATLGKRAAQSVAASPPAMEASLVNVGGQVTVTVRGEVDIATAGALWETLQRATAPRTALIVDLSGTLFIDSSGLDVLLRARRHLASVGSTIVLRSPHKHVIKILEISGLAGIFPIEFEPGPGDQAEHLAALGAAERQLPG
jgi:anti-sigma B factor antagonist